MCLPPSKNKILFITGTDTGIGKTTVACLLGQELRRQNVLLSVVKPIETGCRRNENNELIGADAEKLFQAANPITQLKSQSLIYKFESPLSPYAASKLEKISIDISRLKSEIELLGANSELVIVEGAGGLLVPITKTYSYCDLIFELGAAAMVVVGSKLGALNHAALTFEALVNKRVNIFGYVFNDLFNAGNNKHECSDRLALETNRDILRELASNYSIEERGYFPYLSRYHTETDSGARVLAESVIEYFTAKK